MTSKHGHYHKDVSHLKAIDVYRVLELFGVTDQALGHAIKKLMCAGQRGAGKTFEQDVREAVDTLNRRLQMLAEDDNAQVKACSDLPEGFVEFVLGNDGPTVGAIVDVLYLDNQIEEKKIVGQFSWNGVRAYKVRLATPPPIPGSDIPEEPKRGGGKCFVQGCKITALTGGACHKHSVPTATV